MSGQLAIHALDGVVCDDRFARHLGRELRSTNVRVVLLSPGTMLEYAAMRLAANADIHISMLPTLRVCGNGRADLIRALENRLGVEPTEPDDMEGFILRNIDHFAFPQGFIVGVEPTAAGDLLSVIEAATRLAEGTKNLAGPTTVIVMAVGAPAVLDGCGASPLVWEPLNAWPEHLPAVDECRDLEIAGFRVYLSLRIYWEAAGQPESIERLATLHLRAAEFLVASNTDSRIDAAFDASASERTLPASELMVLFDAAFDAKAVEVVLQTGFVVNVQVPIWRLIAAGLAWRPPGVPHCYITGAAARVLAAFTPFRARHRLDDRKAAAFRRAVHQNCFLASWIMSLTAFVEYEMMTVCRTEVPIDTMINKLGLAMPLRAARERSPRQLAYAPTDDLLSYASFGDLQRIVVETSIGNRFPVSRRRLNEVRNVRNMVAHLHPVTWPAARAVLLALQEMRSTT